MSIGSKIKAQRKKAGLTQKELAKKLGISQAAIGQFENSRANPKIETLQKIADALEISLRDLLTVTENGEKVIDLTLFSEINEINSAMKNILEEGRKAPDSNKDIHTAADKSEKLVHENNLGKTTITTYADQVISLTDSEFHLLQLLESLNDNGKSKAIEQIELLTKIPEYRKE